MELSETIVAKNAVNVRARVIRRMVYVLMMVPACLATLGIIICVRKVRIPGTITQYCHKVGATSPILP